MSLQGCLDNILFVFMPKRAVADDQNDPHVKESHGNQGVYRNALVFFSARVLSHCGFVLSLLAIWLAWLLPTAILQQPAIPDIKKLKSRTKPPRHPLTPTLPSADINVAPILATNAPNCQPPRRVYFADAASEATIVNKTTAAQASNVPPSRISLATEGSPVILPSENPSGPAESLDSLLESDSSSRPSSLKRSSRLTKFKLGFRSSSLDVTKIGDEATGSPLGVTTFFMKNQRASLPLNPRPEKQSSPRFPFRRSSLPMEQDSRASKPIPRTMPYGPPYFATPPILLDNHHSTYCSNRPQLKEELIHFQAPESDSDIFQARTIRRVTLSSVTDNYQRA